MDEFGGDSSQIMFEFVPKNLDFAPNSCVCTNQFMFPHRIIKSEEALATQSALQSSQAASTMGNSSRLGTKTSAKNTQRPVQSKAIGARVSGSR